LWARSPIDHRRAGGLTIATEPDTAPARRQRISSSRIVKPASSACKNRDRAWRSCFIHRTISGVPSARSCDRCGGDVCPAAIVPDAPFWAADLSRGRPQQPYTPRPLCRLGPGCKRSPLAAYHHRKGQPRLLDDLPLGPAAFGPRGLRPRVEPAVPDAYSRSPRSAVGEEHIPEADCWKVATSMSCRATLLRVEGCAQAFCPHQRGILFARRHASAYIKAGRRRRLSRIPRPPPDTRALWAVSGCRQDHEPSRPVLNPRGSEPRPRPWPLGEPMPLACRATRCEAVTAPKGCRRWFQDPWVVAPTSAMKVGATILFLIADPSSTPSETRGRATRTAESTRRVLPRSALLQSRLAGPSRPSNTPHEFRAGSASRWRLSAALCLREPS